MQGHRRNAYRDVVELISLTNVSTGTAHLGAGNMMVQISSTRSRKPGSTGGAGFGPKRFDKRRRPWPYLLVGLPISMVSLGSADAFDVTCRQDQAFRRIQVVTENDRDGLPCDVLLWSTPTEKRRLWRAEFEAGFCTAKAAAMVKQLLADNRWQCQPTTPPAPRHGMTGRRPVM